MLTTLSQWAIYFASYLIDYILILVILVKKHWDECKLENTSFWETADYMMWSILLVMIIASIIISVCVGRLKMNTRVRLVPGKNITHEMTGYLVAQVATVATTVFTDGWITINLALFVFFGIYFVSSTAVYTSPLFVFPLRNRIYQAGENVIITNYSLQEMRIAQENAEDGLQARELTDGVFLVRRITAG